MRGLGLIEVLITLVVLSIGLLGLASLQLNSLRNNQSAMQNSMAVILAYSIVESMQADTSIKQTNARDFSIYNLPLKGTKIDDSDEIEINDPTGTSYKDIVRRQWREEIRQNLGPDASSSINCTFNRCSIVVQWNDSRATLGSNEQQIEIQVQL